MQLLWEILDKLLGLFCWLCTKREDVQTRLMVERNIDHRSQRGK